MPAFAPHRCQAWAMRPRAVQPSPATNNMQEPAQPIMDTPTGTSASSPGQSSSFLTPQSRIFVAGHRGMVGSAIVRKLQAGGYRHIITRTHKELELTSQQAVRDFFKEEKVDYVVLAAAKVGGIHANNTYPAEFIYSNLMIQTNVTHEAYKAGINKILFLGSSCIYPKFAPQPLKEEYLLNGELEPTNEPYALAKIAGIKMCEAYNRQYGTSYRSVMPTNLYGPGDNYHLENCHVIPAMIRKFHLAKMAMQGDLQAIQNDEAHYGPIPLDVKAAIGLAPDSLTFSHRAPKVVLWGTGKARREFLHVEDMADACVFIMGLEQSHFSQNKAPSFLNIGAGQDCTIAEIAEQIKNVVGYTGEVVYDSSKPDGTPQKLLDTSRIKSLGLQPTFSLMTGLQNVYGGYVRQA